MEVTVQVLGSSSSLMEQHLRFWWDTGARAKDVGHSSYTVGKFAYVVLSQLKGNRTTVLQACNRLLRVII